ncbi:hypothetical protein G7Z17_g6425 [Cylindrodendrum hubeiense]|uniref:Fucose-specific lectin n=1 Tax=Cylindrodendrum hubeiense TaxID=595255 RepID=A0A9P5H5D2_9HYPO|nr:hypothetical protein G7Z17_g6425 [Cylindrodendrum hubeiense]
MSFATLWNPLSGDGNSHLLIFYTTSKLNLGIRQWNIDGAGPSWSERQESPIGVIQQGSKLGAIQRQGQICVYGITNVKDSKGDKSCVSLLSPVQLSLGVKATFGRLAAAGDGNEDGWLYFIRDDPPAIYEHRLDSESPSPARIDHDAKLWGENGSVTHLAACYIPSTNSRYVVYQTAACQIILFDVKKKLATIIGHSIFAKGGTPLAIASYVDGAGKVARIIYFVSDGNGALMKARSVDGGDWEISNVADASKPSDNTTLSVSVSETKKHNIIVYSNQPDLQAMEIHIDPWVRVS